VGVEQHRGLVVITVATQRPAEPGIVLAVASRAGDVLAVRAAAVFGVAAGTARQDGRAAQAAGVHGAEGGCGEGGEHARVRGDRLGYAFAASEPGTDELAGVTLVDGRAGRADHLAAVAARGEQDAVWFGGGVVDRAQFAGGQVDGVDAAAERDGVAALVVPGGVVGGLPGPRASVWAGGEGDRRGGAYGWVPQRCWAAWRVMPSRVPISAQE